MPTPDEEVERGGLAAAWAGGHRGRRVIDRLLPQVQRLLSPTGEMFMVTVHENDPAGECAAQGVSLQRRALLAPARPSTPVPSGCCCLALAAELIERMAWEGFRGSVALRRAVDEEVLTILHFVRSTGG